MGEKEKKAQDWKMEYLYRIFSHHTRGKDMENYVVNAIWARLDDLNIKPVTQQYVRRANGYALIDLYFPQINYGIECDEVQHQIPANKAADKIREDEIKRALFACSEEGLMIRRVDAAQPAEILHNCIREIVNEIQSLVSKCGDQLEPWLSPEEKWIQIKQRGTLRIEDSYSFKTITDICKKCFGKPEGYKIQRCFFRVGEDIMIWCPKLAIKQSDGSVRSQSKGWVNELSPDWNTITEYNDQAAQPKEVAYPERCRITFAKSKDERGEDAYRFIGIYKWAETRDGKNIYKRCDTKLNLG